MTEVLKDISQEKDILIQVQIVIVPIDLQPVVFQTLCANSLFFRQVVSR